VVFVVFVIAQLTTYKDLDIPWLPRWLFIAIIDTGLPGALVVLAFGQLMPQLVASTHPVTFMNLIGAWSVVKLTLVFEVIGITHFSWVLTAFTRMIFGLKNGDVFVIEDEDDKEKKLLAEREKLYRGLNVYQKLDVDNLQGFLAPDRLNTHVQTANLLESSCSFGLPDEDPTMWMKDPSVQEIFKTWGLTNVEAGSFPSDEEIAKLVSKNGKKVPRYLLPKNHPEYIPAYAMLLEMTRKEEVEEKKSSYQ